MSVPMKKDDPAYWMLEEGLSGKREIKVSEVYNEHCYICNDSEFALMGLPLCYSCYKCGGHVPADDCVCDNGHDQMSEDNLEFAEYIKNSNVLESKDDFQVSSVPDELLGDKIIREIIDEKQKDLDDFKKMIG